MTQDVLEKVLNTIELDEVVYKLTQEDVLSVLICMPETNDMDEKEVLEIFQHFKDLRFDIYDWSETVQVYIEDLIEHNSNRT